MTPVQLNTVTFREKDHTYWDSNGVQYISGTKLIGMFKSDFNGDHISLKSALKLLSPNDTVATLLVKQQELLKQWKDKGDKACIKGTTFHKTKEDWINSLTEFCGVPVRHDRPHLSLLVDGVYPEMILWNEHYKVAGMADLPIIKSPVVNIGDWKTNEKINLSNKYQKMKAPLGHLDCCHLNHYALQAELYSWMIRQYTGLERGINSIFSTAEDQWIILPNMEREVKLMLEVYRIMSHHN